jgi:Prophage minor tail protein Z (GPZ)
MISCNINTFEVAKLKAQLEGFSSATRARALGRGLAKVAKQGATVAKSNIAKEYNVKAGAVAERLDVRPRSNKLEATITARGRKAGSHVKSRLPLLEFGAKPTAGGVKYKIRKSGPWKILRHGFIATMDSGHQGVFLRKHFKVRGNRAIHEVMAIDVPAMFLGKRVKPLVMQRINEVGPRVVLHELRYELSRLGFKG